MVPCTCLYINSYNLSWHCDNTAVACHYLKHQGSLTVCVSRQKFLINKSVISGTLFFHNFNYNLDYFPRSSFIALYLLLVKKEMGFRDRREKKRSGNNRYITILAENIKEDYL